MPTPFTVPSSTTPTLLLDRRDAPDNSIVIQNQGNASIHVAWDGDAAVTVPGGANPGFTIRPGESLFLSIGNQDKLTMSNAIYAVQTSGAAQSGTIIRV